MRNLLAPKLLQLSPYFVSFPVRHQWSVVITTFSLLHICDASEVSDSFICNKQYTFAILYNGRKEIEVGNFSEQFTLEEEFGLPLCM